MTEDHLKDLKDLFQASEKDVPGQFPSILFSIVPWISMKIKTIGPECNGKKLNLKFHVKNLRLSFKISNKKTFSEKKFPWNS